MTLTRSWRSSSRTVRRVFYPQWNLSFDDADFYQRIPANTITIDVVLGGLIDSFRDLENYGQWLSGWDQGALKRRNEPAEDVEDALLVRLRVGDVSNRHGV